MSSLNKAKLRAEVSTQLRALRENTEEREKRSLSLNRHLTQFLKNKTGVWAGYVALSTEPNILSAIDSSPHIQWVYPRVVDQDLQFHKSQDRSTFVKSDFGVLEPSGIEPVVDGPSISGYLVPGIAFGRDGARLGRGKGYYDRALSKTSAVKVGVCYSLQLLNKGMVPVDAGDEFLNLTISEDGIHESILPLEER